MFCSLDVNGTDSSLLLFKERECVFTMMIQDLSGVVFNHDPTEGPSSTSPKMTHEERRLRASLSTFPLVLKYSQNITFTNGTRINENHDLRWNDSKVKPPTIRSDLTYITSYQAFKSTFDCS